MLRSAGHNHISSVLEANITYHSLLLYLVAEQHFSQLFQQFLGRRQHQLFSSWHCSDQLEQELGLLLVVGVLQPARKQERAVNMLVTTLVPMFLLPEVAEEICQMEETRSTGLSTELPEERPNKTPSSAVHLIHHITQPLVTSQTTKSLLQGCYQAWYLCSCALTASQISKFSRGIKSLEIST